MTQRILSLLLLGAIMIGAATAVSRGLLRDADRRLATVTTIAGAKNRQLAGLRDALAEYERAKLEPRKPAPVEVRVVK